MNPFKSCLRALILLTFVAMPLTGCGVKMMSWQEEVQLGEEAAPQFLEQSGGELPDKAVVAYVNAMGQQLARAAELETPDPSRPPLDWEFYVLDSQVINAFALPGGKVFISRGLMQEMTNEAQLAGVIGHEIGHVTARHGNERMTQALGVQVLVAAIMIGSDLADSELGGYIGLGTAAGGQLFLLKYSRENELEADTLGVQYMARVGYNPVGQVQVMEILRKAGGGGGTPEWLSTHPASDTRIENLEELITTKYPRYRDSDHYHLGENEFKNKVLTPLSKLPPAKHGSSAMLSPADFERIAGIPWEAIEHIGCECHKN